MSSNTNPTDNQWHIITTNTHGLSQLHKRTLWFTYLSLSKFHIIVHTETNSTSQTTQLWKIPNYQSWWASEPNPSSHHTGQGIGISLLNQLAHRVFK